MSEDGEIIVPRVKSGEALRRLAEQTRAVPKEEAFDLKAYQNGLKTQVLLKLEEGLKTPEGVRIREEIESTRRRDSEASLFSLIQDKLRGLIDSPNSELEAGLKDARQILIDAGKEAGVFGDEERGPKYALKMAQQTDEWEVANKQIEDLNVGVMEHDATDRLERRSPDFALMPTEYVRIARLNMDYAMLIAQGQGGSDEAKKIKREIGLLGWGNPPPLLDQAVGYLKRRARGERPEGAAGYEEPPTQPTRGREAYAQPALLPPEYGAVFESSKYRQYARDAFLNADVVPVLDILDPEERTQWVFENMRVFADGTTASPESRWHMILDTWLSDLKSSTTRHFTAEEERIGASEDAIKKLEESGGMVAGGKAAIKHERDELDADREKAKEISETEKLLKAAMAVSASARAMEQSGGVASRYAEFIAPGDRGPDLDKQDAWGDILIHDNPEAYRTLIENPLVKHYYDKLLEDAGVSNIKEPKKGGLHTLGSKFEVDIDSARASNLVEKFLKSDGGGFDGWIAETIKKDGVPPAVNDSVKWAAAKLACDAFIIDKFTQWEYEVTDKGKIKELRLLPFPGWGGNPLRSTLQPSFLPGHIKNMYQGEDSVILGLIEEAFHPEDIFKGHEEAMVQASMVGHLKDYARYSDALWTVFGGSRAQGIPVWTRDVMEKDLPSVVELLDTVYGALTEEEKGKIDGKKVVGAMVARILELKALAAVMESARPGWKEKLQMLFDPEARDRPFMDVAHFIYGPNLDSRAGFLASLASGRERIVFRHNPYGAESAIKDTREILLTNEQTAKGRRKLKGWMILGSIVDAARIGQKYFGGGGGRR